MRFCQIRYDGSQRKIRSEILEGGGHPSIEPTDRYLITDDDSNGDKVIIRLVDFQTQKQQIICSLPTINRFSIKEPSLRLDAHPVWNRDYKKFCFQAAPEGIRQLFIADLSEMF